MLSNPALLYLVYKLFCHNIFQILIYFLFENASRMKKIIYLSLQSLLKVGIFSSFVYAMVHVFYVSTCFICCYSQYD